MQSAATRRNRVRFSDRSPKKVVMKEQYIKLGPNWLYQQNVTGPGPQYDIEYVSKYSKYPHIHDMAKLRLSLVRRIPNCASILDVGYGDGSFLQACYDEGYTGFGYDVSNYDPPQGVERVDTLKTKVDCVTFFDSIEHFQTKDLVSVLQNLDAKGIVISLPWCHWIDNTDRFSSWKHRRPNEHFHHFNMQGLIELASSAGFRVIHASNIEDCYRHSVTGLPNIATIVAQR